MQSPLYDHPSHKLTAIIIGGVAGTFTFSMLLLALFWRNKEAWGATDKGSEKVHGQQMGGATFLKGENPPSSPPSIRGTSVDTIAEEAIGLIPRETENVESNQHQFKLGLQSQRGWISRVLIFFALEMAYVVLAGIACFQPIALSNISLTHDTEAKGVATILTIAWQTVALLPIKDMISAIFSSEWSYIFYITRELEPGKTDRVSIQTAGIPDRLKHFFSCNASVTFRLAFLASLSSIALASIGQVHLM
jgi:hypothetical protein